MVYNPSSDFVGLWRAVAGGVAKVEMPGLDFVVSALGRAGLINVSASSIAPVASQSTTAWFQPASPSYSAEGGLQLWDAVGAAYAPATQALLLELLAAAELATAVPTAISSLLDTLSTAQGAVAFRGAAGWQGLGPGTNGYILTSAGPGANPSWVANGGADIQALLDALGSTQGDILFRSGGAWTALGPGTNGDVLTSGGAGANPAWNGLAVAGVSSLGGNTGAFTLQAGMSVTANKLSFIDSGTLMTFQQTAAPTGWTKQVTHNDKALRVVSGAAGSGGSVPFSTVFAQTVTGSHALSLSEIPAHSHAVTDPGHNHEISPVNDGSGTGLNAFGHGTGSIIADVPTATATTGISIQNAGGSAGHTHTMDIRVNYVDIIIASKDA